MLSDKGYLKTNLKLNTAPKHILVHRMVMAAFHGTSDLQVNHKNGVKHDNRLENLEYVTQSENILHAFKQGAYTRKGEQNPSAKLDWEKVDRIRELLAAGKSTREVSLEFGVSTSAIFNIRKFKKWKPESRNQAVERPTVTYEKPVKKEPLPGEKRRAKRVNADTKETNQTK